MPHLPALKFEAEFKMHLVKMGLTDLPLSYMTMRKEAADKRGEDTCYELDVNEEDLDPDADSPDPYLLQKQ